MSVSAIKGELERAGVRAVPHRMSTLTTLYGKLASWFGTKDFDNRFWMTLEPTIYYPNNVLDPFAAEHAITLRHELVHIRQQRRAGLWWWLVKYLCSQQFRWEEEREAYLINLRAGQHTPESVAASLAVVYRITTPSETEMAAWFERHS